MGKIRAGWRQFWFSTGAQLNAVFLLVVLLFVGYSAYSQTLVYQFNSQYQREINQYHSILELKKSFLNEQRLFDEYIGTGNRTTLAEFNDYYNDAAKRIERLSAESLNEEASPLLQGIDRLLESYFGECCTAAFLLNSEDLRYYDHFYDSQTIAGYLEKYTNELLQVTLESSVETNQLLTTRRKIMTAANLGVICGAVVLLISFALFIYLRITRPLNELKNQAGEIAQGNLNAHVKVGKHENTVSLLAKTFNQMADGIKENIAKEKQLLTEQKKNAEYENRLNEARFLALQSQTNPHFLFNTLNGISSTITLGRNENAIEMLDSLATLLRYNLGEAAEGVMLSEEIEITREYLNIQKLRFSDRIISEIRRAKEIEKTTRLPRFTLQPLVENAIIHGLEPKEDEGRIIVDVKRLKNAVRIRIFDDGTGLEPELVTLINQGVFAAASRHIGIKNICERLAIFTGREDAVHIYSKKNVGTMVVLNLNTGREARQ